MTDTSAASRSLWVMALRRLARNGAAMVSTIILGLYILAGTIGPEISPHSYSHVYADFVRVPPSFDLLPATGEIASLATKALERGRVTIESTSVEGNVVTISASSKRPIDPRITRYLDRTNLFTNATVLSQSADQLQIEIRADVQRHLFLFGTDSLGRDLLARILISLRISLIIGALATGVALAIGVTYGAIAGFAGGRTDSIMMRIVDILYSLPFTFFAILLVVFVGRSLVLMFIAVGAVLWLDMARIVRGQTISLRQREFILAADALGVSQPGIIFRHIIPNILGPVAVYVTLMVPGVILLESFLSFLGLGVQEPMASLGVLIADGARNMRGSVHLLIFPAVTLALLLFALNFLGDGLRDALDPKDR